MVLVHINGSVTLRVETDLETMEKAYAAALKANRALKITTGDGKTRVVNPRQISYFEDEEQVPASQSADRVVPA